MEFWHHHFFSQLKKHTNAKFEKKYHFIKFYREFWAILEVSDITKGDTIITFWNSDTFIGFLTQKNICIRILRWKQVILSLFIMFYCFYYVFSDSLTIFVSFGVHWCHKMGQDYEIWGCCHHHRFFHHKNIIIPILDENSNFIAFCFDFTDFFTILGGQWRHKRGQDYKIWGCWHHHRFSYPKKYIHTNF